MSVRYWPEQTRWELVYWTDSPFNQARNRLSFERYREAKREQDALMEQGYYTSMHRIRRAKVR